MKYKIRISKKAIKFIQKQDKIQRDRIYKAILKLPEGDVKKIQGFKEEYRLRVGSYRIIFQIIHEELIIEVINIDNRGDIYKTI